MEKGKKELNMTAKEAFVYALDEAFVMDAVPKLRLKLPARIKENSATAKMGNAGEGQGADISMADHMKRYHPKGFDPKKNTCKLYDNLKAKLKSQGIGDIEAEKKALAIHKGNLDITATQPTGTGEEESTDTIKGTEKKAPATQQGETPSSFAEKVFEGSTPFKDPQVVETAVGTIVVGSEGQKRVVAILEEQSKTGDILAGEALETLNKITNNQGETEDSQLKAYVDAALKQGGGSTRINDKTLLSKIKALYPDSIIKEDSTGFVIEEAKGKAPIIEEVDEGVDITAPDKISNEEGEERSGAETPPAQKNPPKENGGNTPDNKSQPETATKEENEEETLKEEDDSPTITPPPSDAEYSIGGDKYKVGDTVYKDVSKKGLLGAMIASFMAGLKGEAIITGWDRISGAWDAIKRSEAGTKVRDGITNALFQKEIDKASQKEGLGTDAAIELETIKNMAKQAKTPEGQMKAVKHFQKWKSTYDKPEEGQPKSNVKGPFKPLENTYKGSTPPVSILKKPQGFTADTEYGNKIAEAIQERLAIESGLKTDGIAGVKVGPSATTIKFKVPPKFDMAKANSKQIRTALQGAIGAEVTEVKYEKGATNVMSITVTNPKMREVSFSDIVASEEYQKFAQKAALPIPIGRDSEGEPMMADLAKLPHSTASGTTGAGKSVFLSSAINGLQMTKTPEEARIVLIDPKNEFKVQDGSPHLLYPRAGGAENKKQAANDIANVLESLVEEMNDRIAKIGGEVKEFDPTKNEFQGASDHNIAQYNESNPDNKLPHILFVFDELAFARDSASDEDRERIDKALEKITAVGRSVGIHGVIASQRDDVGSIPPTIQANCPGRFTFKAADADTKAKPEAKALAGNGDFIFKDKEGKKIRGRGCFITPEEEMAVPSFYRNGGKVDPSAESKQPLPQEYVDGISQAVNENSSVAVEAIEGLEETFKEALPTGWNIEKAEIDGRTYWKGVPPQKTGKDEEGASNPKPQGGNSKNPASKVDETQSDDNESDTPQKLMDRAKKKVEMGKKRIDEARDNGRMGEREARDKKLELEALYNSAKEVFENGGGVDDIIDALEPVEEKEREEESLLKEHIGVALKYSPEGQIILIEPVKWKALKIVKQVKKLYPQYEVSLENNQVVIRDPDTEKYLGKSSEGEAEPSSKETPHVEGKEAQEGTSATNVETTPEEDAQTKNEKLKKSMKPPKFYKGKNAVFSDKAVAKLTPKEIKKISETVMPKGWELVEDETFGAPAKTRGGKIFVHNPQNGSHGYVRVNKDGEYRLHKMVDTSKPEYIGMVQNDEGEWVDHPEVQKIRELWYQEKDPKKKKQYQEEYYLKRNGLTEQERIVTDSFNDNLEIIAVGVMDALALINEESR